MTRPTRTTRSNPDRPTRAQAPAKRAPAKRARTRRSRGTPEQNHDAAIEEALETGRPIDLARAHPEPPRAQRRTPAGVAVPEGDAPADRPVADPAAVIAQLSADGGESYVKEHELRTVHRLLMRGTRLDLIAGVLNISVTEVQRMRRTLNRRLRLEASNMDMVTHAGQTMAFFNEIAAMALRIATDERTQPISRIAAMKEARGAKDSMIAFLKQAGFYSTVKFTPRIDENDPSAQEADSMARMVKAMLDPNVDDAALEQLLASIAAERSDTTYLDHDQDTQIL